MSGKQAYRDNVVWLSERVRRDVQSDRCRCGGDVSSRTRGWAKPCCQDCADETLATIHRWGGLGEPEVTP